MDRIELMQILKHYDPNLDEDIAYFQAGLIESSNTSIDKVLELLRNSNDNTRND